MFRFIVSAVFGLVLVAGTGVAADKTQKNQMVKGTIKSVDPEKGVLIINQKLANGVVDRELSITPTVEFVVTTKDGTKEVTGKEGMYLIEKAKDASVQVKCDKDVNVLKVTVKMNK
ncbi:hypothetical protein [Zavarzinella formosa]|uniref:hypothetical protein n=1 Tax=Zavarzinella formosa TaxID=360055 RepID=UPI0002EBA335|nr:hypothetical protein [Zavarzinella formosa]